MATRRTGERSEQPSEWALRELPARAATFLHVVGTNSAIRAALRAGGYGPADHQEGLQLLTAACALQAGGLDPATDLAPRQASQELETWSSTHVPRLNTTLRHRHPHEPNPFDGLDFARPGGAALAVGQLLERLTQMAADDECDAVLKTLARRGLDAEERTRLTQWVHVAREAAEPATLESDAEAQSPEQQAELALYRWYDDWTTTAKALITRRDWLTWLGLRRRKGRD